jgi:hypothetical protein
MFEIVLQRIRERDTEEEEGEIIEKEDYTTRYVEEFEALDYKQLSDDELLALGEKNVTVTLPNENEKVVVIMSYDKKTESFWYYTDHLKEVSYAILETIARKFAIDYDCKSICASAVCEASEAAAAAEAASEAAAAAPSVFATFKKYNTGMKGASSNFSPAANVIEQANHFRFRGKLCDYTQQKIQKVVADLTLDYATYKKLLEKKVN